MSYNQDTVLIVDDNPTNLSVLFDTLNAMKFKVLVATSGEAALESISQRLPDIILLDVMMPGIDGFETCRRLKANQQTKDIPVIFMTALSETVDEVRGFSLGAVDYLIKPVQVEVVLMRVNTHLSIRKLQQAQRLQLAELDAFSYAVAHNLKNPLSVMVSSADVLLDNFTDLNDSDKQNIITNIQESGQEGLGTIEALLLLASIRRETPKLQAIDMESVLAKVTYRLQSLIEQTQALITLPTDWPLTVGKAVWIEEVWLNYLSNALLYTKDLPQIELGFDQQSNKMVRFWVKDNGPGLSTQQQTALFTEFTNIRQKPLQEYGLGLSVVHRIMDKLGGKVGVESELGEGSLFYFTLPQPSHE